MILTPPQLRAALDRPQPTVRLYVFHGPDEAAAIDHAARLGRAVGAGAERIDIEATALRSHPGRLADEAAAMSLFGDKRWVRVTGAGDDAAEAIALLLAAERVASTVVVIAPGLKSSSKVVKLAAGSPAAIVGACYVPEGDAAERIASDIAREHGLRPAGGAARRLADAASGDRAIMTREVEKLALFLDAAPDRPRELHDVALDAIGADLGEADAGDAIDALLAGRSIALGAELIRLRDAGVSPVTWLRQLANRLRLVVELRIEIDAGRDPKPLMRRRSVHFSREDALAASARRWTQPMLARAIERVHRAQRAEMAAGTAGAVLADDAALEMARAIERRA